MTFQSATSCPIPSDLSRRTYLEQVFGAGGILSEVFEGYEPRPGQIEMAKAVDAAIENGRHLLVEAPTGTGKSLGYGVPAVFHAANHQQVVVIVTANIALQEQLVEKDLPLLSDLLPWHFNFALLKGRSNYLCLKRYYREKADLFARIGSGGDAELSAILSWGEETETGDVSELDFQPAKETWRRFSSTADECVGKECRYRRECFAQNARGEAQAADIIVANYSLFFAHLNIKEDTDKDVLLPPFDVAILDEAHRAAELARDFFGFRVSIGSVLHPGRFLKKLGLLNAFEILKATAEQFFADLARYRQSDAYGSRIRFQYQVPCQELCNLLGNVASTYSLKAKELKDEDLAADIRKAAVRCRTLAKLIWQAVLLTYPLSVSFIEEDRKGLGVLCSKPVEVADRLRYVLFDRTSSLILTSATLTTKNSFKYICNEVGVPDPILLTVPSPFDMKGRPVWITKEIGRLLGYAQQGRRLVGNISEKWSDEFIDGHDFVSITGEELQIFREIFDDTDSVSSKSRRLLLLFEPGLHLCLAKTNKPVGRRLRRFLADEVMPQLVRDDRYSPDRKVVDGEVVGQNVMNDIRLKSPALLREERLARQQKAKALRALADLLRQSQRVTPEVAECYEIEAFEALSDEDFSDLKPSNRGFWKGVPEIAHDFDETIWAIGKATLNLGLRGNFPGIAREIELSEMKDGKPVKAYLYSPKAVEMIRRNIGKTRRPSCREADYDLP